MNSRLLAFLDFIPSAWYSLDMKEITTDKTKPTKLRLVLIILLILGMAPPLLALALRFSLKDSIVGFAMIYYAFSPKVLALSGVTLAGLAWAIKRRKTAVANAIYGLAYLGVVLFQPSGMIDGPPEQSDPDVSITFWNISRGRMGYGAIFEEIAKHPADYIGFVEFGDPDVAELESLRSLFPEHRLHVLRGGMAVLSKVDPSSVDYVNEPRSYRINHLTFDALEVLVVDILPATFNDRHAALAALNDVVGDRSRLIIMGDFNTPYESVADTTFATGMTSGISTKSPGRRDSWPYPFPVLAIDQIWATNDWSFTRYLKYGSMLSDHCLMEATLLPTGGDR
jgi:hypothetical protein